MVGLTTFNSEFRYVLKWTRENLCISRIIINRANWT